MDKKDTLRKIDELVNYADNKAKDPVAASTLAAERPDVFVFDSQGRKFLI